MPNSRSGDGAFAGCSGQVVEENSAMSNFASGIKPIGPSYPVLPVQPANKDREAGKRRKQPQEPDSEKPDNDDDHPHIDEHV